MDLPHDLASVLPDAVIVIDPSGRLVRGNPAAERLFGRTASEVVGRSGLDFLHPDDVQMATLALGTVRSKTVGTPIEVRVRSGDSWKLVELVGAPHGDHIVMCLRDLTERRRWEVASDTTARFRTIVQNAGSVLMLVGADGTVTTSSAALTRLLGHDQAWLEQRSLYQLVELADHEALDSVFDGAGQVGPGQPRRVTIDVALRHAIGVAVPFALTFVDLLDDPTVGGLVVTGHDISDRLLVEQRLRHANSLLTATLQSTTDGIVAVDLSGRITSVNDRFAELWQVDPATLRGGDHLAVVSSVRHLLRDPDALIARVRELGTDRRAIGHDTVEFVDGRVLESESLPQRLDGEVVGRVWSYRDITEERALERELLHQALHDPLTGLANRALFRDRVGQATARLGRRPGRLAIMFIDLDDFKTVNDSLGHGAGDDLLVEVGARIERCLRAGDSVARLGGDEFAVLIDGFDDPAEVDAIAQRIVVELRESMRIDGREITTTASVGVVTGTHTATPDELLRNADLAMYTAKANGKDCVRAYAPEMHRAALHRLDLEEQLRTGVTAEEFVVHFQPIVDLATRAVRGFEALVRWQHPDRGLLMPGEFIAVAEDGRLIDAIADQVLWAACEQLAAWTSATSGAVTGHAGTGHTGTGHTGTGHAGTGHALSLAVNISPGQLLDPGFPGRVEETLEQTGVDPHLLTLEITERALMRDPDTVARRLRRIRRSGISIAVDDFGTGYSSLAYLQDFPIDVLKVDRSFVADTSTRPGLNLAGAIVRIARTLDLTPIAEGIESEAQVTALRELGCELGQGYHLGAPMTAAEAADLVSLRVGT